ncbi:MAG: bifunctional phosphopantothenoylcysteine decarboxylase/phosphopantothenate--cysteine ligase CoaBC [Pseudomonadota bacterium]|nr:bifunctional phosphopantothenoylcysteine decarboxylase/phosphopantothenate--cysteine ligase CoaBC [Pseudomonadota bacterium]
MSSLTNKRILLGVAGGIAAYKAPDVCRRLQEAGAEVRVVMTPAACEFITPLTLQAVSGHPVHLDLLDPRAEAAMGHIELARWADLILVAPATADFMARLVQGISDDLLSACCRAATCPIAVAPAMNRGMWADAATQRNARQLAADGVLLFGPASGSQACGEVGEGRMLAPAELVTACAGCFETGSLAGLSRESTAGPTFEPIDPVRYIGNRSSGKMGYAVAEAAVQAGARVTLVSGPVGLPDPDRVAVTRVETAREMFDAVQRLLPTDIFIGVAAVADYRPVDHVAQKIKRGGEPLTLTLEPNPDILASVAASPHPPFTVGFAAETDDPAGHGQRKLAAKGVDMIAANQVGDGQGFGQDDNALLVFWNGGGRALERRPKRALARALIALVAERFHAIHRTEDHRSAARD